MLTALEVPFFSIVALPHADARHQGAASAGPPLFSLNEIASGETLSRELEPPVNADMCG